MPNAASPIDNGRLLGHLQDFLLRYPRLLASARVGIAISGGGDSVALAHLASQARLHIVLLHVNYGLRGAESEADEAFVQTLSTQLNCDIQILRVTPDGKSEDELRRLRYDWFATRDVDAILTGHTRDDQAETILVRILRGTGPVGLTGILESHGDRMFRPLLEATRQDLRQWLTGQGHPWREDSSNSDTDYRRNWLRNILLPQIRAQLNPQVDSALAGLAAIARDEETWLATLVEPLFNDLVTPEAGGLVLDCERLHASPLALQRRLMRRLIERAKGDLRAVDFAHIEAAISLALDREGNGRIQIPGLDLMRSFGLLRAVPLSALAERSPRNYRFPFQVPGEFTLPDHTGVLRSTIAAGSLYNESGSLDWEQLCAAADLENPLELRNWRPGDAYLRSGSDHPEKVKELFQKFRIPLWRRRTWPILVLRDSPVWVASFGPSREFAAQSDSQLHLRLEWTPERAS